MTDITPTEPYVYQPYGSVTHPERNATGRLYGVSGVDGVLMQAKIDGLTKAEASAVVDALKRLRAGGAK